MNVLATEIEGKRAPGAYTWGVGEHDMDLIPLDLNGRPEFPVIFDNGESQFTVWLEDGSLFVSSGCSDITVKPLDGDMIKVCV